MRQILAIVILLALSSTIARADDRPAVGRWIGTITAPGMSEASFASVDISHDDEWKVTINYLAALALGVDAKNVEIDDRNVAFDLSAMGRTARLVGAIDADGSRFAGRLTPADAGDDGPSGTFEFIRGARAADLPGARAYTGNLVVPGVAEIGMTYVIGQNAAGNWVIDLDVPMQMMSAYPLSDVTRDADGVLTGTVPVPGGATFQGKIDEATDRLIGTFTQSGMTMDLTLDRDVEYAGMTSLDRPQEPKRPYPYREQTVSADHPAGFTLEGTLTLPDPTEHGPGPYACAILVSGSGQQDRDETLLGHKPFLIISDYLTRHGIAVMRYDDRGIGGSQVSDLAMITNATSEDFATDAQAVFSALLTIEEVDSTRIGFIGHSEGGMIAPLVYRDDDRAAFMVLLAGPGVQGADLLTLQIQHGWRVAGIPEDMIAAHGLKYREILEAVINGSTRSQISNMMMEVGREQIAGGATVLTEDQMREAIAAQVGQMLNPWMRYFLAYQPGPLLEKIRCPVLAVNGTLDLQVDLEQNLDAIERIMKSAGRDITTIRYEKLNHLFQPAITGAGTEYSTITTTFDERVLADVERWIRERVIDG